MQIYVFSTVFVMKKKLFKNNFQAIVLMSLSFLSLSHIYL